MLRRVRGLSRALAAREGAFGVDLGLRREAEERAAHKASVLATLDAIRGRA